MVKFKVVESLDEVLLNHEEAVFGDIETENLYVGTRLVQLYQPEFEYVYILDTDIIALADIKLFIKDLWIVWHGGNYDMGTLNMTTKKFDDTLYLARTAYPEWKKYSLDIVVDKLGLGYLYEGIDKKAMQKLGFVKGAYLSQRQLTYAATDVIALSLIWLNKRFQATREVLSYKLDMISLRHSIEYQQNTLKVSQADVRKELDTLLDTIAANEVALNGLNPNSPKQVKEALGTDSSDKATLVTLIANSKDKDMVTLAKLVFEQRRLIKRRGFLESYNHPYVVTRFNPMGAATGRFTSTGKDLKYGINAQQIPRDLQYIFNKDTEDTVVVHADYSTAELRAGCSIMKDETMYKELKAGKDLHKIAATFALGGTPDDIDKGGRQKGKAISFGLIFGMSSESFVEYAFVNYGVVFTLEEAKLITAKYRMKYKNIHRYAKARWNDYRTVPVSTPMGRRSKANLGTDAINYATQGCIAETVKLAIHYLVSDYKEALGYIYNVVHDAIYLRVPRGEEAVWAERLVEAMKLGWSEICKRPMLFYKDIPMPVEVEYNDYSSGVAEYKCIER